jgi:Tfp pilus assembly PilM family ATPase/Tfp pilus assembly protein PilN
MANKDISSTDNLLEIIRGKKDPKQDTVGQAGNDIRVRRTSAITAVDFDPVKTSVGLSVAKEGIHVFAVERVHGAKRIVAYRFLANDTDQDLDWITAYDMLDRENIVATFRMKKTRNWALLSSDFIDFWNVSIPRTVDSKGTPNAVYWAAKKKKTFDEAEVVFDYYFIDKCTEKGIDKNRFGTYAVPRKKLRQVQALYEKLGIPLTGIATFPLGAGKLLEGQAQTADNGMVAVVDVKSQWSRIDLYYKNALAFSRRIKTGEASFVDAIREHSAMLLTQDGQSSDDGKHQVVAPETMSSQEALKLLHGYFQQGQGETLEENPSTDIMEFIEPAARRLVSQIERTFAYFRTTMQVPAPVKLVFVGRLANFSPLVNYVGTQLDLETDVLDPFALPGLSAATPIPKSPWDRFGYADACAAALSSSDPVSNLLRGFRERIRDKQLASLHKKAAMGFVVLLAILVVVFAWASRERQHKVAQFKALEQELAAYPAKITPAETRKLLAAVKNRHGYLQKYRQRFAPVAAFAEIASLTPPSIKISSILNDKGEHAQKPGSLIIDGYVTGEPSMQDSYLSNYIVMLDKSPLFTGPEIQRREMEEGSDGDTIHFIVSVTMS